jgi:hypothetical protein
MVMGVIALIIGIFGFVNSRSDIQVIIGLVGTFGAVIMFGMSSIIGRIDSVRKG